MSPLLTDPSYQLTPLEIASGMVWGTDDSSAPLPRATSATSARTALENVVRQALERAPCVVSFSGGRDSSAILALAVHVARREGLPLPVPVTQRFPGSREADEDDWQELVIRHLGLPEWVRLNYVDELDNVGPYAQIVLRRYGVLWPFNSHFHLPIAEQAPSGTLLTGLGGDELLGEGWTWDRVNRVLTRQTPWNRRDLLRVGVAYGPPPLRRFAVRRRLGAQADRPWLRAETQRRVVTAKVRDLAGEPVRWDDGVRAGWWRCRYRRIAEASLACIGAIHEVQVRHPLTDPDVLVAIAGEGGRAGFPDRTAAMIRLVGDLLPGQLVARPTKAGFSAAFFNRYSREFAASWDGRGVDPEQIDVDALRSMWASTESIADARTFTLLQAAWLATTAPVGPAP